jgi:dimethylhistidine N-methyltransferase
MKTRTTRPRAVYDLAPSTERFREEVLRGLRRPCKELPCKYFYDERGSRLFEQICELDEYYLTRTELAIMRRHAPEMAARLGRNCLLIEYGSGSSTKTRLLLDHLHAPAGYAPLDISREHLVRSARRLAARYPGLDVLPICADFSGPLTLPRGFHREARRVVYFPGSTVGNFQPAAALVLLRRVALLGGRGGGLLIGVDLKKDPRLLEAAYNDRKGVTAEFNLNLLARINRELGADFRLDQFQHQAIYDQHLGRIEMHLMSLRPQTVVIAGEAVSFGEGERIRTEYSYKYSLADFRRLAADGGFEVQQVWTDDGRLFSVQYLTVC